MVQRIIFVDNEISEIERTLIGLGLNPSESFGNNPEISCYDSKDKHIEVVLTIKKDNPSQFYQFGRENNETRVHYSDIHRDNLRETEEFCKSGAEIYKSLLSTLKNYKITDCMLGLEKDISSEKPSKYFK